MSGAIDVHGHIEGLEAIREYLYDAATQEEVDEWRWGDEDEMKGESETEEKGMFKDNGKSWVNECIVAISPMSDVMVIANKNKAVFLTGGRVWNEDGVHYEKAFQGILSQDGEEITSALCIPLISSKKSSPGRPDWTCFVIGFSDGYVRMYAENGSVLIGQMFHDEPVRGLKCHSYKPAGGQNEHDQLEEVFILYKKVLVTIDGFGLFQTLRGCRNRIAKAPANAEAIIDLPPLSYKKWQYESEDVYDCESVGIQTPCLFDHLLNASVIGGVTAKPSRVPFTSSVFATVGAKPYVSFHYAQEGQAPFMIGKLAFTVANKLTSGLISVASGWLGFGSGGAKSSAGQNQPTKPEPPKIEPSTRMAGRFGLPDKERTGISISISPCHKLSAVTDSLARVVLIDNERGIAVRMWKGYRDAQCAWFLASDDMNSKTRLSGRKALFLIIYAPRKGLIEAYAMQQGPKVASFTVSKFGRLIGMPYGMMGLNNIPIKGGNQTSIQCVLLDCEGQLQQLLIPFHLALCDTSNSKLKDMHLLKTIQRALRDTQYSVEGIVGMLSDIKTQMMINQAFKILNKYCKDFEVMAKILEMYLKKFCDNDRLDITVAFKMQSLLHLYSYLVKGMNSPPDYSSSSTGGNSSSDNTVLMCLHASEKEIQLVKDMANKELFNKATPVKNVSFADESSEMSINDFMSAFEIEYDPPKIKSTSVSHENKLYLNKKSDNISKLGNLIFWGCFNSNLDLSQWKAVLRNCDIVPFQLMQELISFWCRNALASSSFVDMMGRLYLVIQTLCDIESEGNLKSHVWDIIRKEISQNYRVFYVYTFSIVCRAVTIDLAQSARKKENYTKSKNLLADRANPLCCDEDAQSSSVMVGDNLETEDEGWENVSLDLIRWNILLKQIEDLSFLSTILAQQPSLSNAVLPRIHFSFEQLSVNDLLEKGSGCIAELVGRWLTTIGIDPSEIVSASEIQIVETFHTPEYTAKELKQRIKTEENFSRKVEVDEQTNLELAINVGSETNYILELLRCLKENFAFSLSTSIILSNYCWEYCLAWNKNVENVHYMNAAIKCVAAIPSCFQKQGLMSLMWATFISKQLSCVVEKWKIKREALLENVLTSSESKIAFLQASVQFLDEFMETNVLCQGVPPQKASTTKTHWSGESTTTASLTDLVLTQPLANYEMILLHYQLSMAALLFHQFGIKKASMKPINLFDTKASTMLFEPINSPALFTNVEVDLALKVLRQQFLGVVVTNVISKIPEDLRNSSENGSETYISPSAIGVKESEAWINRCVELGKSWGVDIDGLRINQVCELYSCGFDLLGLEVMGAVTGRDILGSRLLTIAGMRLHYYIMSHKENTTEIVSSMSTNLSNWLNKQDYSKLRCLRFSTISITELASQLLQLIPESNYDHKLAEDLLVCSSFLSS